VHLVTRDHFRSRDKGDGPTVLPSNPTYSKKPHDTRKPHGSVFYRTGVMGYQSFTLRE